MSKPVRLQEWIDKCGKWVHVRLQPPTEPHDVIINQCDGKLPWRGQVYPSAATIDFASDALLVDVRYDELGPEDDPLHSEFKGGRFTVTLLLPTLEGVVVGTQGRAP